MEFELHLDRKESIDLADCGARTIVKARIQPVPLKFLPAEIYLKDLFCPDCGSSLFSFEDYMHVLEHEIVEAVTTEVITKDFNNIHVYKDAQRGFDRLFCSIQPRKLLHNCYGIERIIHHG